VPIDACASWEGVLFPLNGKILPLKAIFSGRGTYHCSQPPATTWYTFVQGCQKNLWGLHTRSHVTPLFTCLDVAAINAGTPDTNSISVLDYPTPMPP